MALKRTWLPCASMEPVRTIEEALRRYARCSIYHRVQRNRKQMPDYVWGRNPILETLRSTRQVKRILIADGQRDAPSIAAILHEAEQRQVPIETVSRQRLDQLNPGADHRGNMEAV